MRLGRTNAGQVVDLVEHDFREVLLVRIFAVREDIGLTPARVSLLHTFERSDRFQRVLRVTSVDGHEDVRTRGHPSSSPKSETSVRAGLGLQPVARVLLTGPPGSGKTTLVVRVASILRERGEQLAGFTTSEIRRGGRRTGFVVTGMGGLERTLARRAAAGPQV